LQQVREEEGGREVSGRRIVSRRGLVAVATVVAALAAPASAGAFGIVEGTVTPVALAQAVEVCDVEPPAELCIVPGPGGAYQLGGLPELGPLHIEFLPPRRSGYLVQYYDHKARLSEAKDLHFPKRRLPGEILKLEGTDADLELGSRIEGTVTSAPGGAPLEGVEVCVQELGTRATVGCAETDGMGAYTVIGLLSGGYSVGFWGRGSSADYVPQFYDRQETLGGATMVTVSSGSIQAGIDAELLPGARVEGTVSGATGGAPLSGLPVCLFEVGSASPTQCAATEPSGAFTLRGIVAGEYQVGFAPASAESGGESVPGGTGYLAQYYRGAATRAGSQVLSLGQGQIVSGVDAALLGVPGIAPIVAPPSTTSVSSTQVPVVTAPHPPAKRRCPRSTRRKRHKSGHHHRRIRPRPRAKLDCGKSRTRK
jgi:hypothetical protein